MPFTIYRYNDAKQTIRWIRQYGWQSATQQAELILEGQPPIQLLAPSDPTRSSDSSFNPIRINPLCNANLNNGMVMQNLRSWLLPWARKVLSEALIDPEAIQLNLDYSPEANRWFPQVWIDLDRFSGLRIDLEGMVVDIRIVQP